MNLVIRCNCKVDPASNPWGLPMTVKKIDVMPADGAIDPMISFQLECRICKASITVMPERSCAP